MRFSAYEPRGRFRAIRARPYQFDITVIGGGFLIVMVGITIVSFIFPLFTHQFYNVPSPDSLIGYDHLIAAREAGLEGEVLVRFRVDDVGKVIDPMIVKTTAPGVFDAAVLDAVSQWSYGSFRHLGRRSEMLITERFRFRMPVDPRITPWWQRPLPIIPEQVVFGSCDTPPKLIHKINPVIYAPSQDGRVGVIDTDTLSPTVREQWRRECLVTFTIDEEGVVSFLGFPRRSGYRLDGYQRKAIREAVMEWRFLPATRGGVPVTILVAQRVEYLYP